jgi:hypothetical protein
VITLSEAMSWLSAASGAAAGASVLTPAEAAVTTGAALGAGTAATAPGAPTVMIFASSFSFLREICISPWSSLKLVSFESDTA